MPHKTERTPNARARGPSGRWLAALVLGAAALGCDGQTADPVPELPDMSPPPDELQACSGPIQPGPAPLRRLTRVEYDNTVFQLLSDNSRPARAFPPDEEAGGFDNQAAAQSVSPLLAENYLNAAETLAARTAERRLPTLAGCPAPSDAATCEASVRVFIQSFGLRAYRRPLAADEIQEYLDLFDQGAALGEGDFDARAGFELMTAAMLQSPHFLYRVEFGEGDPVPDAAPDVTALNDYEIATRLSYFFWNTMPDEGLFEAAARGELHTAEQIEAQARRLLATPRAREAVKTFHRQWLGLDEIEHIKAFGKNPEIYPDYDETLLPLLQEEAERFVEHVIFDGEGTMSALFTAPYSMMNRRLAEWYGVRGPEGDDFEEVDLDPAIYSGFLSQAGLLALHSKLDRSSPIHRGLFVRKRLLCQIPPPPPDVVPEAPLVDETQTTRQQFAQHKTDPLCAGCHRMIDEIGFGFESFDGLGRYRETEWGLPIDDTGNMFETVDIDGPFDGVVGLGERLAGSEQVRDCVVRQWFRFGQGRVETVDDACTLATLRSTFEDSGRDIRELLVTLPQTDAFRYRRVVVPGGE